MQGPQAAFENAGARGDHISQSAVLREHIEHLLGAGSDGKADIRVHGFALEDREPPCSISVEGGVGAGADADLVDLDRADLLYGLDIIRAVRAGRHRRKRGEVDVQSPRHKLRVGDRAASGDPILLAALSLQECTGYLVGGENRGGSAELRAHVGDGGALRNGERFHALAAVFDDLANAALNAS